MVPFRCLTPRTKLRTPRDTSTKNCYNKQVENGIFSWTYYYTEKKSADLNCRVVYGFEIPSTFFLDKLSTNGTWPNTSCKGYLLNWRATPLQDVLLVCTNTSTHNSYTTKHSAYNIHSFFYIHTYAYRSSGMCYLCMLLLTMKQVNIAHHCLAAAVGCFAHQAQQWRIDDITKVTLNWPTLLSQFWETRTMICLLSTPG